MAVFKCTNLIQLATADVGAIGVAARVAGWSESWYFEGDLTGAILAMTEKGALCQLRAACLPRTGAIVGQRYQQVDPGPVGPSVTRSKLYPGNGNLETDVPQMALLLSCPGQGVRNVKHFELRGVPDDFVKTGEYAPAAPFDGALKRFIGILGNFKFKGQDFAQLPKSIVTITPGGNVTTVDAHGFNAGDFVRLTRLKQAFGVPVGSSTVRVLAPVTATTFGITPWVATANVLTGQARKVLAIYPTVSVNDVEVERVVTRKVGRPFDQFRGRH